MLPWKPLVKCLNLAPTEKSPIGEEYAMKRHLIKMAELINDGDKSPGKSSSDAGDQEFEPTADMLVHDFDDEQTLAEEEAMALAGGEDPNTELSSLQKESDMPLEELLALYGYGDQGGGGVRKGGGEVPERGEEDEEVDDEEDSSESSSSSSVPKPSNSDSKPKIEDEKLRPKGHVVPSSNLHLLYSGDSKNSATASRLLRSAGSQGSDDEADEDEDIDYAPGEEEPRKTIMIGSDYQASVPSGLNFYENSQTLPYENEDKLLWSPYQVDGDRVEDYLQRCCRIHQELMQERAAACGQPQATLALLAALPQGAHTRDDEQALHLLLQCGYNLEEALRRRKMSAVAPCDTASLWSEEECRNFECGLRVYGKDFHTIQQNKVRTRAVGELVQFYYLWKKTERHDILANRARLEKKKYSLHPGTTDYMDRFLDDQESINNGPPGLASGGSRERSNSRSSSPNVHSLISGDPKRLRGVSTPPLTTAVDEPLTNGAAADAVMADLDDHSAQVVTAAAAAAAAAAAVLPIQQVDSLAPQTREQYS